MSTEIEQVAGLSQPTTQEEIDGLSNNTMASNDIKVVVGEVENSIGEILCKISFLLKDDDEIEYIINSHITDKDKPDVVGSFTNGVLDVTQRNTIQGQVTDYIGDIAKLSTVFITMSLATCFSDVEAAGWYNKSSQDGNKWAGFRVPQGYKIANGMIGEIKINVKGEEIFNLISTTPCIPIATGDNLDTKNQFWIKVKYADDHNRHKTEWLSKGDLMSKQGVRKLIDGGLGSCETDAHKIHKYLNACMKLNSEDFPKNYIVKKNGWKLDNTLFVCGNKGFEGGQIVNVIPEEVEVSNGLAPSGTVEDWVKTVKPIIHYPLLRFKMYACFAAPLLRLLDVQSFIVDHNCESSSGKTISNDVAISMIGNPNILRFNGNTTQAAAEALAERYTDLPFYLDETGTQQKEDVMGAIIYMLANGQGRMRGKKEGGIRETGKWKTVALTNGERSILSNNSFTGMQVRVIDINSRLTDERNENIGIVGKGVIHNNGHFVEPFFKLLNQHRDALEMMFKAAKKKYDGDENIKSNRLGESFAAILVAGRLVENMLKDVGIESIDPAIITDKYFKECVQDNPIEDFSIQTLQHVMDWVQENRANFDMSGTGFEREPNKFYGWKNGDMLYIIPGSLDKAFESSVSLRNANLKTVKSDWKAKNIIVCENKKVVKKASYDGERLYTVCFNMEEVNKVLFTGINSDEEEIFDIFKE